MQTPIDVIPFVRQDSVVRKIWGDSDIILFIFAGAAAEFALNKAVDWLYFTGRLPADPLGRLFSTVGYARKIVFSSMEGAHDAIDTVRGIHQSVESSRGTAIPDWAYRDVLFMLVYYSISAFELFRRRLSLAEKEEVYNVFFRVGIRMGLQDLPVTYTDWLPVREEHLEEHLVPGIYTSDLFRQYRVHLGAVRYKVLIEGQKLVVPRRVKDLLRFGNFSALTPVLPMYKLSRMFHLNGVLKNMLLPADYRQQIKALDMSQA